ncbi:MAG: flagellar motor switch protein FliN [Phycisphaeraceae bacterium]|nr:flagellar motor switch protein FliN [Phycisphaeraceae bacterium]
MPPEEPHQEESAVSDPEAQPGTPDAVQPDATAQRAGEDATGARPVELPTFRVGGLSDKAEGIGLLSDVNLTVKIELGRTRMFVEDVLRLGEGSVVELDKLAGDPVDVYVNDRLVARGEVLVLNDNFCVRVNEIVAGAIAQPQRRGA